MNKDANKGKTRWTAIILAGGKGTRMNSPLPKVLHPVAGRPMIKSVIESVKGAGVDEVRVVVGHGQNLIREILEPMGVTFFVQLEQKGTADAVKSAQPGNIEGNIIILNGDHPLLNTDDIKSFIREFQDSKSDVCVVTATLKKPGEFGRIVRSGGEFCAIVEAKDASSEALKINEVNTGIYLCDTETLNEFLPKIRNQNLKGEFYLTDLISLAKDAQAKVGTINGSPRVAKGVNNQIELADATRLAFLKKARSLMESGVLMMSPETIYIEQNVNVAPGAVLHANVHLKGTTTIGAFSVIEPNCIIVDSLIAETVQIKANSYLEKCEVQKRASVGPFARIRPETTIGEGAHVGNFVEMKKVKFGAGAKAGHLTYLGDADIGADTNIGCGTITCNYAVDKKKYKTKIGANVFVGSDSQFVAPVEVGDNAVIASGSTIVENVPSGGFAVARGRQYTKSNYKGK